MAEHIQGQRAAVTLLLFLGFCFWAFGAHSVTALCLARNPFVVADHFVDDEPQEFFGKLWV
jgi:hypothetical protein